MLVREIDEVIIKAYGWEACAQCDGYGFLLEETETVELPQGYRNVQTVRICRECCGSGRAID
jgi:DnaJ-class molecular chaperone